MGVDGALRTARRRATLTQRELADKADVGITTVRNIEAGMVPSYPVAERLAQVLDISPEDLWSEFGHSRPHPDDPPARALRLRRHLSQRQVAEMTGLKVGVVHRADRGLRLSLVSVRRLAMFYGVHPDDIQSPIPDTTSAGAGA